MDRDILTQWSAALSDDEFPQALAALGVLVRLAQKEPEQLYGANDWRIDALPERFKAAVETGAGILCWELPTVSAATNEPQIPLVLSGAQYVMASPEAKAMAAVWRDFLKQPANAATTLQSGLRLSIQTDEKALAQAANIAALLAHPQVGATGVHLTPKDFFSRGASTDWLWPFTVAILPNDPLVEFFSQNQQQPAQNSPFRWVTPSPQERRVEILVSGIGASDTVKRLDALGSPLRCRLLIVTGFQTTPFSELASSLKRLAARTTAAGIAVLYAGDSTRQLAERLYLLFAKLTPQKLLDQAFAEVFQSREMLLILLWDLLVWNAKKSDYIHISKDPHQAVPRPSSVLPTPISNDGSFSDQSSPEIANTSPKVARYIQQKSRHVQGGTFVENCSYYICGHSTEIEIYIGPKEEGNIQPFLGDATLPKEDSLNLQILFYEPNQFGLQTQDIVLPREGKSGIALFKFTPQLEGSFEGRILILYQWNIVQICILKTHVFLNESDVKIASPCITLTTVFQSRSDFDLIEKIKKSDIAFKFDHTQSGTLQTGIMGQEAWATNLKNIEDRVLRINNLISNVARSVQDYDKGLDKPENCELLVNLSRIGAELYSQLYLDQLKRFATKDFDVGKQTVTRIQVISNSADAVIPLEFIYDFDISDDPAHSPTVCPKHRDALKAGQCPDDCPRTLEPTSYVCPMGFWGLKKTIERHIYDPETTVYNHETDKPFIIQAEPVTGRDRLDFSSDILVAYSKAVKPIEINDLINRLNLKASIASSWKEWVNVIQEKHPTLLVAFPHNEGKDDNIRLEIGGDKLYTLRLNKKYVRIDNTAPPLVFLLGCDVAGTAQNFSNHIRHFRQAGAAVVVSTIATVFGSHAVQVGEAILSRLIQKATGDSEIVTIGDAIQAAKREALLDSIPMALCVVAFGDAEWRL